MCHVNGLAVLLDLVLNHAGPRFDDESLYFFDRLPPATTTIASTSLTRDGWAG
jgi:1,4-alpha-glucan branching enzyme